MTQVCSTLASVYPTHVTFDPRNLDHQAAFLQLLAGRQSSLRFNLPPQTDSVLSMMLLRLSLEACKDQLAVLGTTPELAFSEPLTLARPHLRPSTNLGSAPDTNVVTA